MASPEDLLAQRNKIQRQILELESTLGADSSIVELLSSSSGSDEESDDSGHAGQEVVPEDLEAKRQQIQREIDALEKTLGGDAALVDVLTDSEHGSGSHVNSSDEDSDDDELDLPQNAETCLQMNLVYQEVLKEKLSDLERLLSENQQQQKEIEAQLSGPASTTSGLPHLKLFLGTFMKPYFKDKLTGLGPPANEETREKLSHGTRACDEMKIRRWEAWQKTLLINSVVADTMKRMLQPKLSKMDYLTTKMSKAKDEDKEVIKKQIAILEKTIEEISSMKEDELYGNRHDDHDWDKIANTDFEGLRQPDDLMRFWQNYLHPSINKSTWKEEEIENLAAIAEKYNCCHWDQIAEALGTNRTAFMCFQAYQRYIARGFRRREWTKEEDQALRDLVERMRIGNFIPYTQMSYFMEGRDYTQLMYRWTSVLDPSIKKGPWSKEEDELLLKAVEKHGPKEWWKIRMEVPGRTDNACRDRYLDCLRDDVRRGAWSDEEVELLKIKIEKYGVGKWAKIASEIPNRIDSQCLNKWKWMMRTTAKQKRRAPKAQPKSKSKRRKVARKKIAKKENSDIELTSEDESMKVEYMDSDEDRAKDNKSDIPSDNDMDPREEYVQPDMKEWIPVSGKAQVHSGRTVRTMLVRLPTEEEANEGSTERHSFEGCRPVRSTVLDQLGNPFKTYMDLETPALDKWDLCDEKSMIKVPMNDIKQLLICMRASAKTGRPPKTITTTLLDKTQRDAQSNVLQQMTTKRSCQILSRRRDADAKNALANNSLNYTLMMALLPWLGNVLIPLPVSERKVCEADIARTRAANVLLPKTPVFLFFLKVLHIDAEGCKKVIEAHKNKPTPSTELRSRSAIQQINNSPIRTVAMLLAEKEKKKKLASKIPQTSKLALPTNPQENKHPQTGSSLMSLQAFVVTQPNTHQRVGTPHPVGQAVVPILQSGTQDASKTPLQPVLQLGIPVEPGKSAQPAPPPTSSASASVPSTEHSEASRVPKRKRQPTMKAQALMENVQAKASKRSSAKNKRGKAASAVAVGPQTTAWLVTPAGLMPVTGIQLQTPVPGDKNQVMSYSVPKLVFQPPAIANQNVVVSAVADKTTGMAAVTNATSVSSVPPKTTNVATSVTESAVQTPPPEIQCNQSQNILNVVPQVPLQSPIIVSHNGSLALLCNAVQRPTISSCSSQASVGNKTDSTCSPEETSQSFTQSSGSDANKVPLPVSKVVGVSSASVDTTSPAVPPAQPSTLNTSGPLIQMPSPTIPSNQNQKMMHNVPRVLFQQPLIMKQNGSLTVINSAGPRLPKNGSPALVTNAPEVPVNLASSVSSTSSVNKTTNSLSVTPAPAARGDTSTVVMSPAAPGVNFMYGLTVPSQHSLPVNVQSPATVRFCANSAVRPGGHILPQTVVRLAAPPANNLRLQTATTTSHLNPYSNSLSFDSNLMFLEHPDQVKNWMKGNSGISLPELEHKMPYLPPFVSNIKTLVSLLKAKEYLLQKAVQLLPEEDRTSGEEEAQVTAVRKLISEKFQTNPAYSLLKARFLSCFTLPALLATIHPCKELQGLSDDEDEEDGTVQGGEDQESFLNTNESEASATQFSGMSARKEMTGQPC
ncbi:snRNA-activating protein complex subunit 4 isoform X2 [Salminus brasiliensis]|uniref:snRNA-activating protein complex subunit 4 isoform X2 n=1 Tax=Salminus brasiliensis TaxID=930266 RepID=UPI003B82E97D